ncbi:hypothetical protein CDQ91_20565 [Sphingopyxis witflariensis]|uniref:HMA domain-containing protein n=1 Tax=Sphingopyxis witflariensis TaxID=173675 RepID=A0A2D0AMC1_9SPHN|nr:hypothetical protein CDQ91_20565 [Sphingopyxis witflariensis]
MSFLPCSPAPFLDTRLLAASLAGVGGLTALAARTIVQGQPLFFRNVDLASKTVSVSSTADVQHLKQAIEKAGFAVTHKAPFV